jgi:hypothetical protein
MTWWFHLLVRRVETLRERVDVLERVMRAAGHVAYAARTRSLFFRKWTFGRDDAVHIGVLNGECVPGFPSCVYNRGSMYWDADDRYISVSYDVIKHGRLNMQNITRTEAYDLLRGAFHEWRNQSKAGF